MIRSTLFGVALLVAALISLGSAQVNGAVQDAAATDAAPELEAPEKPEEPEEPLRFVTFELFINPAGAPLAAWQVRIEDPTGAAKLVGVEGGNDPSFKDAPLYDPRALQGGAIVLAAFDTEGTGPAAETLVARVHLAVTGDADPEFNLTAEVVASPDGPIQGATARLAR